MEYAEAKVHGDRGERIVANILGKTMGPDDRVVNDVLLDAVDTTTQIDHLLIDRFGILVIETKHYQALIKGRSEERTWTACYKGGRTVSFHNPIAQNEGHRTKMLRVLKQHGIMVDPSYIQSVIVFAAGNIEALALTATDSFRVLDSRGLEHHLATRVDFAPNPGAWGVDRIDAIADALENLNLVADSDAQRKHTETLMGARSGKRGRRQAARRIPVGAQEMPAPRVMMPGLIAALIGALLILAGALNLRTIPENLQFALGTVFSNESSSVNAQPASNVRDYDAQAAFAALEDADPELAQAIANPDSPKLSVKSGYETYTWDYARKTSDAVVKTGTISVSLDEQNRMVGFTSE